MNTRKKLCLGLTGRMAAGKGEAVKLLQKLGFTYISLSDLVREEAQRLGGNLSREQMQDLGNRMRKEEGPGVLGKKVRKKIEESECANWVIDGIRNPAEVQELKKKAGFYLIGIEAEIATILKRMRVRARDTDQKSEEELRRYLDREWGVGEPADGQRVGDCLKLSDFIIRNNGTLAALERNFKKLLKKVGYRYD